MRHDIDLHHHTPNERTTILPVDSALAGMALLGDNVVMLEIFRRLNIGEVLECCIAHIRYKPITNCVIAYELKVTNSQREETEHVWLYAKCYTVEDFAAAVAKAETRRAHSVRSQWLPAILTEPRCIVYDLPHDTELPGLATVLDSRKLVRVIQDGLAEYPRDQFRISDTRLRVQTVRYKPEKRAVFRVDSRVTNQNDPSDRHKLCLYLRLYADNQGAEVFRLMSQLHSTFRTNSTFAVPSPISYNEEKKLLLMHRVDGCPVNEFLTGELAIAAIEQSGTGLAQLHRFTDTQLLSRSTEDLLYDATVATAGLSAVLPEIGAVAESVLSNLRSRLTKEQITEHGFIHGDFHPGQVLFGPGAKTAILDYDRSGHGDQLVDLGNFLAHLHLLDLSGMPISHLELSKRFVLAYEIGIGRTANPDRIRSLTVVGLLQLAISPFRNGHINWRQLAAAIINRCREIL